MATRQYTMITQIDLDFDSIDGVPQKDFIRKCCFIHLKNSSTSQRFLYSMVIFALIHEISAFAKAKIQLSIQIVTL